MAFTAPAGGGRGARTFVSKTEITGAPAAVLDIVGFDSSSRIWEVDVFIEATADGAVQALLGLVAAFKTTGYRFHVHTQQDNSATYIAQVGTADNQFAITQNQAESTVVTPAKFTFRIYDPAETDRRKKCEWEGVVQNNSARVDAFRGGGMSDVDNTAFDTLRIRIPGTTLAVGTVGFLYKMAQA